jgi:hypothetical protein
LAMNMTRSTPDHLKLYCDLSNHTFHFISDSKAALLALVKRTIESKTVINCDTHHLNTDKPKYSFQLSPLLNLQP